MSDRDELTLAEAVPLATVLLQRLLAEVGIRSLAIKGPTFVTMGVRRHKQSNDVDLIVHPRDRSAAADRLKRGGWESISYPMPAAARELAYSVTYRSSWSPVTVDVHHEYPGLLVDPGRAFEALWRSRTEVDLAGQDAHVPGPAHALVIEALTAFREVEEHRWPEGAARVVGGAPGFGPDVVAAAAREIGAEHTAAPLVTLLGGAPPTTCPPRAFEAWRRRCGRHAGTVLLRTLLLRAPWSVPAYLASQLTSQAAARSWAEARGVEYRSPAQVLWLRLARRGQARRRRTVTDPPPPQKGRSSPR